MSQPYLTTIEIYDLVVKYWPGEQGRILHQIGTQAPQLRADLAVDGGSIIGIDPPPSYTSTTLNELLAEIALLGNLGPPGVGVVPVLDEGTPITTAVSSFNFVGAGVTAAAVSGAVTITFTGAGVTDGDKGDITVTATGATWTVDNSAITNAKLANIATARFKGRVAAGTGDVEDLTAAQMRTALNVADGATANAGTVTSVGMSVPTGFTVSGSPVSGAGTLAVTYTAGFVGYTTTEQTKLAGIAAAATANATDAALRDRGTHTGAQLASTISDFDSASRAQAEAALLAGANVTLTPAGTGPTRTITIASSGGGGADFTIVTAGQTLADDTPLLAVITTNQTFALPASPVIGDEYVLRNSTASTVGALAAADPGAGRTITHGSGQSLAVAETLTAARGETIHLVCRTATVFELMTPGAVGPEGPPGGGIGGTATVTITTQRGVFEHAQTVAATGVTPASRINISLNLDATDVAENDPEMLDVASVWAVAGTNQITFGITFGTPTSGPITFNWSAF